MKKEKGFSLIELLIILIIVMVIALMAIPFLQDRALRAHRVEARNALQGAATRLTQVYLVNNGYKDFRSASAPSNTISATDWLKQYFDNLPIEVSDTAGSSSNPATRYVLSIEIKDDGYGYDLTATAVNKQAKDKCKTITLNSRGIKGGTMPNECWR